MRFPKIFVLTCSDESNQKNYWFLWFSNSNFAILSKKCSYSSYRRAICSCSNYPEHIRVFAYGGLFVPVVHKGGISDVPCSNYRSILSFCRYYMEDFDYQSILVDSGSIVQWSVRRRIQFAQMPIAFKSKLGLLSKLRMMWVNTCGWPQRKCIWLFGGKSGILVQLLWASRSLASHKLAQNSRQVKLFSAWGRTHGGDEVAHPRLKIMRCFHFNIFYSYTTSSDLLMYQWVTSTLREAISGNNKTKLD